MLRPIHHWTIQDLEAVLERIVVSGDPENYKFAYSVVVAELRRRHGLKKIWQDLPKQDREVMTLTGRVTPTLGLKPRT